MTTDVPERPGTRHFGTAQDLKNLFARALLEDTARP